MKSTALFELSLLAFLVGGTLPAMGAQPAEQVFRDDFAGRLAPGWSWVREEPARWRMTAQGLEVQVLPGNMWGPPNDAKNVLVRNLPHWQEGEIEISVTVSNQPTHQYEQADLVWYYDDSHMVKIGQELVDKKLSLVMGREEKDRTRTLAILPLEPGAVRLGFLVHGRRIRGRFIAPGATDWREAGECDLPDPGAAAPKISLQCYQGERGAGHWARFAEFRITRRAEVAPLLRFDAKTAREAQAWQQQARRKLSALMMGGAEPARTALAPQVARRIDVPTGGYVLEELTLQTLPDRRAHVWLARPAVPRGRVGAVLAINGHGGNGEEIVRGLSLYWYGRALAEMGYVVIAPDVGQHQLQHAHWTLMGERTWDALRCLDYVVTLPEVDPQRLAVAGLSLGGETAMYVAALDERVKVACSSGWLTTVANMKNGHCVCFNFPGLEEHFDFADIFSCVAPRGLVCELGEQERAPGGFPVSIGRAAFARIRAAYGVFNAESNLTLTVHSAGHVFDGRDFWPRLHGVLGTAWPWTVDQPGRPSAPGDPDPASDLNRELARRGEIARRSFARALGVLDGWWKTRDAATGLFPRRLDQPVWAPADNAADMLPFLAITAFYLAPERLPDVLGVIPKERALTTRFGGLPDWFSITNRAFVHPAANLSRLIFGAAEYAKDGLVPMTEVMGRGPWLDRLLELMDAIWAQAPVASNFGPLPAEDSEVNGDLLQALARMYAATRDPKYLAWAARLGDAYCLEVLPKNHGLPPHRWDFSAHRVTNDVLNLNDHGNELIGGLAELYAVVKALHPEKAAAYREPLRVMFHRLLDKCRNEDGLWFNTVRASTGEPLNRETPDTWGYAWSAAVNFGIATGDDSLIEGARQALRRIHQPRYLHWNDADAFADALEGALYLLNRLPIAEGRGWVETMLPLFLSRQRDDGIVEGWYGDGNYARTALQVALHYTEGTICQPWSPHLRVGALREAQRQGLGEALRLALHSEEPWAGRVKFDLPRHRLHLGLPVNYPRLNEFPEWFTVEPEATYVVTLGGSRSETRTGRQLMEGFSVQLARRETLTLHVRGR